MKKSGYNISEWNKVRLNDLQSPSARKSLPATSGVYVVFYKVKGTRIRRLGAEDKQKVFYIGQTKNTRKRLHDFCKDVARLRRGDTTYNGLHIASCTLKYWFKDTPFKQIFGDFDAFYVKYYRFKRNHDPKREENILIQYYFSKFADLPPLNYSFPIRYEKRALTKNELLFARVGLTYP